MITKGVLLVLVSILQPILAVNAPSRPTDVSLTLINEYSPMIQLKWSSPVYTYGRIKNYRIYWGQKDGTVRFEKIPGDTLKWNSDFLYDNTLYDFELRAENKVAIGPPVILSYRTPQADRLYPPNRRSKIIESPGTHILRLTWDHPGVAVFGYRIFYKEMAHLYTKRWNMIDINPALQVDIPVNGSLSTTYTFHVIAYTDRSPVNPVISEKVVLKAHKSASDSLTDTLTTILRKVPDLWALQAGIAAIGNGNIVNRSEVQQRQTTQTKKSEKNSFSKIMKTFRDFLDLQADHYGFMEAARMTVFK